MSKIAIKVENLSKAYQLGNIGTGTISRDIERWWARMRGKEDPFLRIGETNDRTTKSESNIVWSLKDINFKIMEGEAVGIIGSNGAGKSTLLKILSRVTAPTNGRILGNGRIASLLEVGTGFHPELTGRENIYLNGAILGMRKREIDRKFDEIVNFSGVERYIDTPVKRYSSGMYVRLAFAVAAHLESEILIVDEVLAVGDTEFQKKCLGKMGEVSRSKGKTVLFVSHNMNAVKEICNRAILLSNGSISIDSTSSKVLEYYLSQGTNVSSYETGSILTDHKIIIKSIKIEKKTNQDILPVNLKIHVPLLMKQNLEIGVAVNDYLDRRIITTFFSLTKDKILSESLEINFSIPMYLLTPATYRLDIAVQGIASTMLDIVKNSVSFELGITGTKYEKYNFDYGIINKELDWEII